MHGNSLGQGIDISYNMNMGMSMVEGCTVVGGMEGITTHSSMTDIVHDKVSGTELRGISVTEMSMGTVIDNEVSGALGIGIYCNDRSMCMIEHNTVLDTRPDIASGNPTRRGYGVLASFQSQASLRGNQLSSNPVPMGAVINSQIAATH
jgi:parallel beta-helix repeat protein